MASRAAAALTWRATTNYLPVKRQNTTAVCNLLNLQFAIPLGTMYCGKPLLLPSKPEPEFARPRDLAFIVYTKSQAVAHCHAEPRSLKTEMPARK